MTDEQIHNLFEAMGRRITTLSQRVEFLEALQNPAPEPNTVHLPPVVSATDQLIGSYAPSNNAKTETEADL